MRFGILAGCCYGWPPGNHAELVEEVVRDRTPGLLPKVEAACSPSEEAIQTSAEMLSSRIDEDRR